MAYRPPQKATFSTTYTPKYMAGDFKSKKVPAPDQPSGLSISAYRIGKYIDQMVSNNDLRGYKHLFEQIKILVKSVMKVLCEKKFTIDLQLWREINSIHTPATINDTVITFPVQKYEYERWVVIFRSLIPSVHYPFNAKTVDRPLNTSESIELISPRQVSSSSSNDYLQSEYSDESPSDDEQSNEPNERFEEWYETAVYAYQNLLLTSSSKKRELIDQSFQEANSKARNRIDRNKAHEARSKAINDLKKGTYDWVNRIGHIVKHYGYIRINSKPERLSDINYLIDHSDLLLMNGILNGSFNGLKLVDKSYDHLLDSRNRYPKEEYVEMTRFYRNKDCISRNPAKERMFYDTIASLSVIFMTHHYDRPFNDLLHEFDVQDTVLKYLDGTVSPQSNQIRTLINRLTDRSYDIIKTELSTYNLQMVREMISANIKGEPQQKCIVRMMAEFDITDLAIREMITHQAKRFESYHNTVAWCILYGVVPFEITKNESIFEPKVALDIYISLLNDSKINPQLIKIHLEEIKETTDKLIQTATGYAKFRLMDAYTEANNAIINI